MRSSQSMARVASSQSTYKGTRQRHREGASGKQLQGVLMQYMRFFRSSVHRAGVTAAAEADLIRSLPFSGLSTYVCILGECSGLTLWRLRMCCSRPGFV